MVFMPENTDEQVAEKVQNGDIQSFALIVERYQEKMIRYARRFLFNSDEAQDLVQEVFIKSYVNIKSFDLNKKFSSWIYRIAHNEFINAGVKKSKLSLFSFDFDVLFPHLTAKETADGDLHRQELKSTIEKYLNKLDSKYREPLVLYYFEEMDYKEIAEILRVPVSTVGVRIKRAKTKLKNIMKKSADIII
jgi:RNA polymerase sigma-70 factor, ECF subfamily